MKFNDRPTAIITRDEDGFAQCENPDEIPSTLLRFLDLYPGAPKVKWNDYSRVIEEHTSMPEAGTEELTAVWESERKILVTRKA